MDKRDYRLGNDRPRLGSSASVASVKSGNLPVTPSMPTPFRPRFTRLRDAPSYFGMDKNRVNRVVNGEVPGGYCQCPKTRISPAKHLGLAFFGRTAGCFAGGFAFRVSDPKTPTDSVPEVSSMLVRSTLAPPSHGDLPWAR